MQPSEKLVMMANQIAKNLAVQGEARAPNLTADHIMRFWDPRMRAKITEHLSAGGKGLDPLARKAVEVVASRAAQKA